MSERFLNIILNLYITGHLSKVDDDKISSDI